MRLRANAVLLAVFLVAGCFGTPEGDVVEGTETHDGETYLPGGALTVPAGTRYEQRGGVLDLGSADAALVGVVDVAGTIVLRDVTVRNLLRFTIGPGAVATLDGVVVEGTPVAPSFDVRSRDATFSRCTMRVHVLEVSAPARVQGCRITADSVAPAVLWRGDVGAFEGNTVVAPMFGAVFERSNGTIEGNTFTVGEDANATAVAARGGALRVVGNTVTAAGIGIGFERADGEASDNDVTATSVGIGARGGRLVAGRNTVVSSGDGIGGEGADLRTNDNVVSAATDGVRAGIGARQGVLASLNDRVDRAAIGIAFEGATGSATSARIAGTTVAAVVVRDARADVRDARIESAGGGILYERASGLVSGNAVVSGTDGRTAALGAAGGAVAFEDNDVGPAAIGIGLDGVEATVARNKVHGTTLAGVAVVGGRAEVEGNTFDGNRKAGLYLESTDARTTVEGNVFRATAGTGGAAIEDASAAVAIQGGSPAVTANDFAANEIDVAILAGSPTIRENNLEGSTRFAVVRKDSSGAALDVSQNWWGAASGPVPATDTTGGAPVPGGPSRVGPGLTYAPWSVQRRG